MRVDMAGWVALFFQRPIRLSDVAAILHLFKKKRLVESPDPDSTESVRTPRPLSVRVVREASRDAQTENNLVGALDVSELPLDTLPADLQDELRKKPDQGSS